MMNILEKMAKSDYEKDNIGWSSWDELSTSKKQEYMCKQKEVIDVVTEALFGSPYDVEEGDS
jgi:predicted transcriptional regulator